MAILGIDEVGRGPLAGPLVVGAVILPEQKPDWVDELKDSKKLTAKKRNTLSEVILKEALATGLGWVSAEELDEVGVSEALKLATRRAVKSVQEFHVPFSQIIIDGKVNFLSDTILGKYVSTLVKADNLIKEVSAASIIAKVARDRYMEETEKRFPGYGFDKNVGYGTKAHFEAIAKLGICPEHRLSYEPCKSLVSFSRENKAKKDTTRIGVQGESAVCEFLISNGHEIVGRNFKTRLYEIDIVSIKANQIYFTEVKYRKNNEFGDGLEAITYEKQKQMKFAAESFLLCQRELAGFEPLLAVAAVGGADFTVEEWLVLEC